VRKKKLEGEEGAFAGSGRNMNPTMKQETQLARALSHKRRVQKERRTLRNQKRPKGGRRGQALGVRSEG